MSLVSSPLALLVSKQSGKMKQHKRHAIEESTLELILVHCFSSSPSLSVRIQLSTRDSLALLLLSFVFYFLLDFVF